jgi:hypothetical protein
VQRSEQGMRAGGYGLLLAAGTLDELIYHDARNEVFGFGWLEGLSGYGEGAFWRMER